MCQTRVVTKIERQFRVSFFSENFALYEVLRKNVVKSGRTHVTIYGARVVSGG